MKQKVYLFFNAQESYFTNLHHICYTTKKHQVLKLTPRYSFSYIEEMWNKSNSWNKTNLLSYDGTEECTMASGASNLKSTVKKWTDAFRKVIIYTL